MSTVIHSFIYTAPHTTLQYRVEVMRDYGMGAPHTEYPDCHGVVMEMDCDKHYVLEEIESGERIATDPELVMRLPLFKLLHVTLGYAAYIYYDTVASINKAIRDWGAAPEDVERVVEADFKYIDDWYADQWFWVYVRATKLNEDGTDTAHSATLGGYESTIIEDKELLSVAAALAYECEREHKKELHRGQLPLI